MSVTLLGKFMAVSRKIHRICLFAVVFLILIMGTTGLLLKYPSAGIALNINLGTMRYIHNLMSIYFAFFLGIMMITGIYMYIHPYLIKRAVERQGSV